MEPFNICLAGHIIRIFPQYPYIKEYCRDYICEGDARVAISTDEEDLRSEMQHAAGQERFGVIPHQEFSAPYLETLAVYRKIADYLTDFDTLLFHGSAVAMDGEGYLFTAKSGTGKVRIPDCGDRYLKTASSWSMMTNRSCVSPIPAYGSAVLHGMENTG